MAALDFPASPTVGQVYTAGGVSWTWDGVSWGGVAVGAVTSPVLYSRVVTSGSQASVTFTGFPSTGSRAELRVNGRSTDTVGDGVSTPGSVKAEVQFNADTGSNYGSGFTNTNSSGTQASGGSSPDTTGFIGALANSNASNIAGDSGECTATIPAYAASTRYKQVAAQYSYNASANPVPFNNGYMGCIWRNTAAITQILVKPGLGNWVDGSVVELWIWY